jgi:hypothetical protein
MTWTVITEQTEDMAVHAVLVPGGEMGRILYSAGMMSITPIYPM